MGWIQIVKSPLLLRNWKVLNSHLYETLCLECVASWNTYYEWYKKYEASRKNVEHVN